MTEWKCGEHRGLTLDQPRLMGVLNVTPDSFSDGGIDADADAAVDRALTMVHEGASVIDVGGESTRPGALRIDPSEQVRRVVPVIERLRAQSDVLISVDTTSSTVAAAAIEAGADIINDVAAAMEDSDMLSLATKHGCGLVLMHRLMSPKQDSYSHQYQQQPHYDDVVVAVKLFLAERCEQAIAAGVHRSRMVIDPGLGFGKSVRQNYELIRRSAELQSLGYPVLSAASRKSFIGQISGVEQPAERVAGSLAVSVAGFLAGIRLFRVHDVAVHRQALAVAAAIAADSSVNGDVR